MHSGPELANVECVPYVNRQVIRFTFWCVKLQRLHFGRRILARTIGQRLQAVAWLEIDDRHKSVLRRNVERMTRRDLEDIVFCLAFELEAVPTIEALIRLAQALDVSLDDLLFAEEERGPSDDLRLRFEAVSHIPEAEKLVIKALLDGMILKYQAPKKSW